MNTQVNPETAVAAAPAAPSVAVAATAPVALTPIAEAIAPVPAAAPAPAVSKSVLDDFLDDDEPAPAPAPAAAAETPAVPVAEQVEDGTVDDSDTIAEFEDGPAADAVEEGAGGADVDALDELEAAADEEEESGVVIDVYKKKCTSCQHLVPWAEKKFSRCHFSNGNDLCPAQSVRIRRYIPVDEIVARFMAAESQGSTSTLIALYANLEKKAPDVQEEIHAGLKRAREAKALKAAA